MKFETIEVSGWKGALWGLRLPMSKDLDDAKSKSDSLFSETDYEYPIIGKDDLRIAQNLIKADEKKSGGQPNSKFLRMIHVQVGITAPMYFWSELDTYKVGTVANSTSKMHKLSSYPINQDCFEMDDFENVCVKRIKQQFYDTDIYLHSVLGNDFWSLSIKYLEELRQKYNELIEQAKHLEEIEEIKELIEAKKARDMAKKYWKELLRLLPNSYLQTRVFDCNYEVLRNICCWRENHKLNEWSGKDNPTLNNFIAWVKTLPYADELIFYKGENNG